MQYFKKGAANLCGMVELVNEEFSEEALKNEIEDRLMPRTEELPLYTMQEFNDKVVVGAEALDFELYLLQPSMYLLISRPRSRSV